MNHRKKISFDRPTRKTGSQIFAANKTEEQDTEDRLIKLKRIDRSKYGKRWPIATLFFIMVFLFLIYQFIIKR
ncbi:hypothetical protein JW877_09330 [bacterium]|nr:hypothetical protein [bacterium]